TRTPSMFCIACNSLCGPFLSINRPVNATIVSFTGKLCLILISFLLRGLNSSLSIPLGNSLILSLGIPIIFLQYIFFCLETVIIPLILSYYFYFFSILYFFFIYIFSFILFLYILSLTI